MARHFARMEHDRIAVERRVACRVPSLRPAHVPAGADDPPMTRFLGLQALAEVVPHGAVLALPPDNSLSPCALARALISCRAPWAAAARRAGFRLRHGSADRCWVRGGGAKLRRVDRRERHRSAIPGRTRFQCDHHAGRHLPGDPHDAAGGGKGCAVHAAARDHRQRHPGAPAGLEGHRQPIRGIRRSHRATSGVITRYCRVPCGAGRCGRQRVPWVGGWSSLRWRTRPGAAW